MRFSLWGKSSLTFLTLFIGLTLFQGVISKDTNNGNGIKDYEEDYISDDGRYQEFSAGKGERGLFPNIFNLATHADIRSTATCGQHNPEYYCKLVEHVFARAPQCDICDANNHLKNHPIEYAIDGTPRWWQSPSLGNGLSYEKVNITLDLRQEYQIAYVIIKAGNAPRPGTWVLEKSLDGINYSPWQYYATSDAQCMKAFGVPASRGVPKFSRDDEVTCTSFFSKLDPLDNGEIHTSLVNGRPSAEHPSQTLQNFTRARFVRMRLLSLRTLNADLMIINNRDQKLDQSVTRRYFYSIKDISIGGQCICYGHAESCPPEEVHGQFRCECRHNTCGESCNECCPLYNQLPWQPGTHAHPNVCQPCQCFNHADTCVYDESVATQKLSVTPDGIYEGGGKCVECRDNTEGINCEKCKYGFYRPSNISHYQHDACHACNCDTLGSEHNECVRDETAAFNGHRPGDCICKPGFGGRRCEKCAPGYRNYPVCEPCPCNPSGSLNFDTCEGENCICKSNVEGKFCDQCKPGTIFLNQNNPQGCQPCFCFGKSTDCKEGNWAVGKISSSQNWNLTGLHNHNENVVPQTNSSELLIFTSSDFERENSLYYWKAPPPFSGNLLNSYGGDLHYYVYFVPQRDSGHPTPVADVIIEGNGIRLEHYSRINFFPRENISVTIPILERQGWYNSQTRQPIDKSDLMRALSDVKYFLVRARYNQEQLQSSIYGLTLETAIPTSASLISVNKDDTTPAANKGEILKFEDYKMNGVEICECPEHFTGNSCEKCEDGFRRVHNQLYGGRCEKCNCEGHSEECDPFTGSCLNCKHNTTGPRCEQCRPGFYGNPLLGGELGACKPCACPTLDNNHSTQCALSQIALEGAAAADQGEYVCTACETGYDGNKCEVCADGYFGDPTSFNGTCQPCACNGNIDPAAIGNCDPSTGECLRCIGHTTGTECEKCEENHWGSALDKTCRACGCHRVGSVSLQCSNTTGLCECNENYIGDRCDSCVSGHGDVENGCPSCDCDLTGSTGTSCNQVSGQCSCKSGVYGKRCDMCIPSYYNFTEAGCNFCHCDEYGSVDQKCSNTTGECECRPNVEGTRCDHCTPGFFNITSYQGCQECQCNELGSSSHECNVITGQCVCKDGVTGIKCDKCEPNHWGLDENGCKQCQICPAPGQVCDPVTGECVCPPNTVGEKCEACTKNSWNYDAYRGCELCDCSGVGADSSECDAQTGQCKCLPGFVGHKCDRCEAGYFNFPNCEPCNCDINGTDPMECRDNLCLCSNEGQCKCKTHSTGLKCDQCDANSFSLDHTNPKGCTECFCFNRTNFCVQNSLVWQQVYANDRRVFFEEPFEYFDRNNLNIQILKQSPQNYNSYLTNHAPLYWPLPKSFLGDKTLSYNGYLRFKIWNEDNYRQNHGVRPQPTTFKLHPQVILMGNDRIILENTADEISDDNKYKIRIHESKWRNKISPQLPVSRQQLMVALQNLQGIYIRGTYNDMYRGDAISLRDVSLDVAVENVTDNESQSTAIGVELCGECPKGYSGASCQNPAEGYCRKRIPDYLNNPDDLALVGYATPCACNGHSTSCDPETCRCSNCQHNTMGDFCEICKAGYHGDAKEGSIDSCTKCACPLASNSFSDTCIPAETGRGYACNACKPGYAGIYCESCVAGYYGDPNIDGGFCAQCACHPYGSLNGYCHNVTGQCECRDGVEGRDCSVCRPRHAFIDRVCTSCDQGCYKDLMVLEDEMFAQLETVKNLSDSKPIPNKRLRNINEAVTSFSALLSTIKQNEESAADLFGNPIEENKNIKEARLVINEAKYLEERSNDTLKKLRQLQNDITEIRKIEHEQNRRVYDISTQLNSFSDQVSRQHSGGNVETMVSDASALLDQLKERERQIEKQINYASKNAEEAEEILKRVLSKKLNDTSYDMLFEAHEDRRQWIKDFRDTIWDNAKVNATAARKLTEVVNKRLESLKDLVAQVENATEGQKEILAKAKETVESIKQQSLNSHDHYQEVKDDTLGKLNKATENVRERSVKEQEELANEKHKLHAAENHAKELEHQTKKFKIEMANIQSGSMEALSAINAYKDIVQALTNASEAADQARKQAEEAFTDIDGESENSLVSEAAKKLNTSNFLKNAFAETTGSDVSDTTKRLHAVLERIQKSSAEIEKEVKSVKDAQDVLDDHEDRINNIHVTVAQANEAVENSAKTVDRFAKDVDDLKDRADAVNNFNEQAIQEDINNVTESSQVLSTSLAKLEDIRTRGAKHSDELKTVRQKLAVLKEKINEAKEKASKVRISVKSDPRTACARQYISPAHPSPTTTISIQYRPALEIPDALLFLTLTKSRRTQAREYIAIELKERRIIVHWNIGSGSRRATNSHNINHIAASDRYTWYHIDVTRIGNAVKVAVGLKQQSLGEGAKNVDEPTEVALGEPDATNDVILNTIPGETKIYIGYDDVEVTNELGLGTNKFAGVIGGLKVDNQPVPLWVFVEQTGQCDGAIGAPQTAARGHFFRNGFAQIRMPMTERVNTLIRIVYSAYSRDGLLYFRGSSEHGDFVAVELRDGAIYVKANYGENSYVEAHTSLSTYSDGRVHAIKITRNQNEIDLQVDEDSDHVTAAIPGENNVLNIGDEDAHYVGGIPSDFDKTPFEERDISWSGFVGCIQLIKPNQVSELDLDHPIRSQRKEPGCEFKDAQLLPADGVIGFPKPGYLVTESIRLGTNSSLAFNMRTKNSNAVLLYQKALKKKGNKRATDDDEKTFFVFYIFNGRLIVHLGTDHSDRLKRPSLSSNQSYNDGRLHSVFFARNGNSVEVRIDDREILKGHLPDDTIIGTENSKLYFGGLPDWASKEKKDDMGTSEPLIGCLSDFYFNFEKWSIIPEEHHAQLGTCAFDDDITAEADEATLDEQKSFERKNSKLSVQRAAPTFVSSSDTPESAALLSSFDQNLVGAIPLTETCRAPSMKETEAQIAEGARYGATESSHSKINFASPYPDFKSFKLDFLFRTESANGTLWVWANYKKYTLYFFLYMEDGFLTLDVKGKDTAVKQLQYKERRLDDGEWHAVDFRKQEHEIQLQVDNLAVETLKDVPHPRVTRKRMFIGGVISRHKKEFNFTRPSFNGCIKDFVVDGISRDLHAKSRDVILCKNTNDVSYIHHGGYASFGALKTFSNTEPNTIEISFKLRSTTNTGLLFALLSQQEYNTTYLFANMTSESIIFTAVHSDKKLFIEHKVPLSSSLCPSEFHRFHLTLTRTNLHIRLNDARGNLQVSIPSSSMDIYRSLPIHIGGVSAKVGDALHLSSFNGCLKDLYFSGTVVPLSKAKKLHKIIPNGCPLI